MNVRESVSFAPVPPTIKLTSGRTHISYALSVCQSPPSMVYLPASLCGLNRHKPSNPGSQARAPDRFPGPRPSLCDSRTGNDAVSMALFYAACPAPSPSYL